MSAVLLFCHVLAVIVWVGGMAFAHLCLRPALTALPPPERLPLMNEVLGRFFRLVTPAVLLIVGSGFALLPAAAGAPAHWHAMAGIGLTMALIYAYIRRRLYPALQRQVAAAAWPAAATALGRIRNLVALNLILGVATVAIAILGRLVTA